MHDNIFGTESRLSTNHHHSRRSHARSRAHRRHINGSTDNREQGFAVGELCESRLGSWGSLTNAGRCTFRPRQFGNGWHFRASDCREPHQGMSGSRQESRHSNGIASQKSIEPDSRTEVFSARWASWASASSFPTCYAARDCHSNKHELLRIHRGFRAARSSRNVRIGQAPLCVDA